MVTIFLRQVSEAENYNFGMGFSKELLLEAQLTSSMVNGEDLPTPGERGGDN